MVASESPVVSLKAVFEGATIDMRLYYGARDNLVQELTYNSANRSWQSGFSFAMLNGNSGLEYYQGGSVEQIVGLNSTYGLEVWWKEFNTSFVASPTHPVRVWTRGK